MIVANPLAEEFKSMVENKCLNFTHRAAHGGKDDADVIHGDFSKLAVVELEKLKRKYPGVFADPVYLVDHSDCDI